MSSGYTYVGRELSLAAGAVNWKRYWGEAIGPYLGARVLEVGAGIGANVAGLCGPAQTYWLALEPDPDLAEDIARRKERGEIPPTCEARVGTVAELAPGEMFDTVLYIDVIEHIEDDRGEIDQAVKHLDPGGHLVVLAPAHPFLFSELDRAVGHYRRYTTPAIAALAPGLKLEKSIHLDSLGAFASLANRFLLRSEIPSAGQLKFWDGLIVRLSKIVDPVFGYRFGKSLLAVWRKEAALGGAR